MSEWSRIQQLEPKEIARRLAARECLGCGIEGMEIDPDTGFPFHYCFNCREWIEKHKPKQIPSAAKLSKEHKAEGLDNIDKWMGLK